MILFAVDCEKGEGPDLAKQYGIPGYPTYVMLTPDGERSAAWLGYDGPESFHEKVTAGIADPRPVTAKAEAYAAAPTVALARVLADDAAAAGRLDDSVTYLRKARELDPAGYPAYTSEIMGNMFFGARKGQFTLDEVDAEASQAQAMAQMGGLHDKVMLLAMRMAGLAAGQGEPARAKPYLERAMTSLQAVPADELPGFAPDLRVAHALIVEGNKPKALELKLAAQPEGWQDDIQATRDLWQDFVARAAAPVLAVPSAITPHTRNYLINPALAEVSGIRVSAIEAHRHDPRFRL